MSDGDGRTVEQRLGDVGLTIPEPPKGAGNYVPYVVAGDLVFVSGQIPLIEGETVCSGQLGRDADMKRGVKAARACALNLLSHLKAACDGDLSRVVRVVRLGGFVSATPEFEQHPAVIDGASELMIEAFGEAGRHARAAVGVASLPRGVSVEIDGIFQIAPAA